MGVPFLIEIPRGRFQATLTVTYDDAKDAVCGGVAFKDLATGKVVGSREICVPIAEIRDAVMRLMTKHRPANTLPGDVSGLEIDDGEFFESEMEVLPDIYGSFEIGSIWKRMKRRAHKAAKKIGTKKLIRITNKLLNDPRFAALGTAAGTIYPPLGVSLGALQKGAKLLDAAKKRDPAALAKVAQVTALAKSGDPAAAKAAQMLMAINDASKAEAKSPQAVVSGWVYNRPYRSNLSAGALDKTNPGHVIRSLYHMAVNR